MTEQVTFEDWVLAVETVVKETLPSISYALDGRRASPEGDILTEDIKQSATFMEMGRFVSLWHYEQRHDGVRIQGFAPRLETSIFETPQVREQRMKYERELPERWLNLSQATVFTAAAAIIVFLTYWRSSIYRRLSGNEERVKVLLGKLSVSEREWLAPWLDEAEK